MTNSVPSSTSTMIVQLSTNGPNTQLLRMVTQLLTEQVPLKITIIKGIILSLLKTQQADIWLALNDTDVFGALFQYYKQFPVNDDLYQFLNKFSHCHALYQVCEALFEQRWDEGCNLEFRSFLRAADVAGRAVNDAVIVILTCRSLAEATLAALMLETVLYENYNIPLRSSTKFLRITFEKVDESEKVRMVSYYRPEDYLKVTGALVLDTNDRLLTTIFCDKKQDFYNYCMRKYGAENTRGRSLSYADEPPRQIAAAACAAIARNSDENIHECSGRLLIITRTVIGSGNFTNARVAIEGICRRMPKMKIDWVVANDGDSLPRTRALPPQVTMYETDELWKLFPLIRSLSLKVDLVASLPNNFLAFAEEGLPDTQLTLSSKTPTMMVIEYNTSYEHDEVPKHYLTYTSGLNAGESSLGLLRPEVLDLPITLDEKRVRLCQDEKAIQLFHTVPNAPFYFGYAYLPRKGVKDDIQGLKMLDILALYVQHAKLSHYPQIKIVLPIDIETIQESMRIYPTIFADCKLCFTNAVSRNEVKDGSQLGIEVFNLFPFENITFRLLMDYATAHNTPVVCTGDQSLMEFFFTLPEGALFLYQLLSHKAALFKKILEIAVTNDLPHLNRLLRKIENSISSERELIDLTSFLIDNQDLLKRESRILAAVIKQQPDLIEGLTRAIASIITTEPSFAAILGVASGFGM